MSGEGIKPTDLVFAVAAVVARTRGRHTVLRLNDAGNLAIIADGAYVGFIDMSTGAVTWNDGYVTRWAAT